MGTVQTNADDVIFAMEQLVEGFDFELRGAGGKGLGVELLDLATLAMRERAIDEGRQPDGVEFDPNADSTEAAKNGEPVGVQTGNMLSLIEMQGERTISNEEITQTYGKSEFAKRKAQWFTRGSKENAPSDIEHSGARDQPARPFWGLDPDIEQALADHVESELAEHVDRISNIP